MSGRLSSRDPLRHRPGLNTFCVILIRGVIISLVIKGMETTKLREIPLPKLWWNSAYWINETGTLRKRFTTRGRKSGFRATSSIRSTEQSRLLPARAFEAWSRPCACVGAPQSDATHATRELENPAGVIAYNLFYCDEDGASSEEEERKSRRKICPTKSETQVSWASSMSQHGVSVSGMGRIGSPDGVITRGGAETIALPDSLHRLH